jgi:hypothetical protein
LLNARLDGKHLSPSRQKMTVSFHSRGTDQPMSPSSSAATAGITITFPKVDQLPLAMSSARESIVWVPSAIILNTTTLTIVNVTNWGWFLCFKAFLNALPPEKLT